LASDLNAKHPFWNSTDSSRETNCLVRLERIRNFSTTMPHTLFSSWQW
jgi:hypothetical protein